MTTTNSLAEKQNQPKAIELLAAFSQFYAWGKNALAIQIALTVGLSGATAVVSLVYPNFKIYAVAIGASVTWLDVVFLDRIQICFRKRGALVQEQLDQMLFEIPWNELRAGKPVELEEIYRAASNFLKANGDQKLRDWYPSTLSNIPLSTLRIICQRSCLWWDTSQRRVYGYWLTGLVTAAVIALWVVAIALGLSFSAFVLSVYAPVAPAMIWAFREMRRQKDASDSLEKSRNFLEGIWKRMGRREISSEELLAVTRQIQDTLFENRSKNPLIFNWIYRWLRSDREATMRRTAEELASEIPPLHRDEQ